MKLRRTSIVLTVLLAGPALGDLGDITFGPIDIRGQISCSPLGVQDLDGHYYVSARNLTGPHKVWVFDAGGNLIPGAEFEQGAGAQTSAWGYRDGASDGHLLYFGYEGGLYSHEPDGSNPTLVVAGSAPGGVGTWRALAYDPTGDNGRGSLWVSNFSSPLVEVDMQGLLLRSWPGGGWSLYGLAYDHCTGNLWASSDREGYIFEIVTTTGQVGRRFEFYSSSGSLTEVPGGAGGSGNALDVASLESAGLIGYEIALGCPGDLNCDGAFNGADIDPFFLALGDPTAYARRYPDCDYMLADMNGDGAVNGADIDPFFEALGGGP